MASIEVTSLVQKYTASSLTVELSQHMLAPSNDFRQRKYLNTNVIARMGLGHKLISFIK
jgi:hypothetical protein